MYNFDCCEVQVIDLLLLYGGDVEKFAGDCMIVVFVPTQQEAQGGLRCPPPCFSCLCWVRAQLAGSLQLQLAIAACNCSLCRPQACS